MSEQPSKHDQVLLMLAMNLQGSAMVQMGKLADPASGEVVRDLESARYVIDVLEMLQDKSRDNTHDEIVAHLNRAVMELQMNYTDEVKKEQAAEEQESTGDSDEASEPPADEAAEAPAVEED